ncbi:MAG: 50S ribosomal protein L3 [Desulfobacteraceae bacterium]
MCKGMLGKKVGMTSVFASDGRSVPVTVVQVGPCVVTQVKSEKTDGYSAVQLGFDEKSMNKCSMPQKGHFEKSGNNGFATLREFRVADAAEYEAGQSITLEMFSVGDRITVSGVSKGRGFAGTVKRYGFGRGPETHGSRNHRAPGSVGCSAWPARIVKGKKMPGHLGVDRKTVKNLEIVDIRPEENIVLLKGAVPGAKTGVIEIKKTV